MALKLNRVPHRRLNLLTREWILVSPHRTLRPWQGQTEEVQKSEIPSYDPACYMCPGNQRACGQQNSAYTKTFVFDNDFPALLPDVEVSQTNRNDLLVAESERGICRVICYSPRHDLTLSQMEEHDVRGVVDVWAEEFLRLGNDDRVSYVQIFENRGAMMGASNPHPHGQIWASSSIPNEIAKEQALQRDYLDTHKTCLLCDYLRCEQEERERIVFEDEDVIVLVPFWAIWPFETMVLGKRHVGSIDELGSDERSKLARSLIQLTQKYDRLFNASFPYSMGFHQRPSDGDGHKEWHLHAHFYPPLLRSATIRKFMVGYELLAGPQRDITPESAADRLRKV